MRNWFKKYDIWTRLLSVLIAVILWIYVVNVVNPNGEIEITGLSVDFLGSMEALNAKNLTISNMQETLVNITLAGKRNDLVGLSPDNVYVTADVSMIKDSGTYDLPYKVTLPYEGKIAVTKRNPARVSVTVSKIMTSTIPVKVEHSISVPGGFLVDEAVISPANLTVTGLVEEVSQISYALVKYTKNNAMASISEQARYSYVDSDGNVLDLKNVSADYDAVDLFIPVLKSREARFTVTTLPGGGATEKNVKYAFTPEIITVAGEGGAIDALNTINLGSVDLSRVSNNSEIEFPIVLPEGMRSLSGETDATVKVTFEGLDTKTVVCETIEIINIPRGFSIEPVTQSLNVTLRGEEGSIQSAIPANVKIVVDLSNTALSKGQHTVDAAVKIEGLMSVGSVGTYKVVIMVK